jgi:selenocysteine lyase/cysteine desulfurase
VNRVRLSPASSSEEAISAVQEALTPRTKIVALSHIMFTCGLRLPLTELVKDARAAGALVLLDGAQTAGHVRLDLRAMDVDFYAISGQKWLLGPASTGALYVRPDRGEVLTPLFTRPGLDSRTGLRMYGLTSDSTSLTAGFAEAVQLHLELGPEAVEARIMQLAKRLRSAVGGIPAVRIVGPRNDENACGLTTIAVDGWGPEELANALWEEHRIAGRTVPYPAGIRLSMAAFNDESDVDRVAEAVHTLARRQGRAPD